MRRGLASVGRQDDAFDGTPVLVLELYKLLSKLEEVEIPDSDAAPKKKAIRRKKVLPAFGRSNSRAS